MLTGTNLVYTKQYNLRIVHEVVRRFGPLTRADIAQRTELTVVGARGEGRHPA